MNKGLEVIEAHWLFGLPTSQIEVLLHPQSVIHSLVEYEDGSLLAQLGTPDMRIPIAYSLAWPERVVNGAKSLDLLAVKRLDFDAICLERYPCLQLAYDAITVGGTATAILNAANEVAVQAFLSGTILFTQIVQVIERVLTDLPAHPATNLETVLADDANARQLADAYIKNSATERPGFFAV